MGRRVSARERERERERKRERARARERTESARVRENPGMRSERDCVQCVRFRFGGGGWLGGGGGSHKNFFDGCQHINPLDDRGWRNVDGVGWSIGGDVVHSVVDWSLEFGYKQQGVRM